MNRRNFIMALACATSVPLSYAMNSSNLLKTVSPKRNLHWKKLANSPVNMQEIYPCVFNGKIYVAGALQDGNAIKSVFGDIGPSVETHIFDSQLNSWGKGADLPEKRHHLGLAATSDALYGIGGFDIVGANPWHVKDTVFVLPKRSQLGHQQNIEPQWHVGPSLPQAQAESVYGTIHNNVHVVGGRAMTNNNLTDTNAHWVLIDGKHWESAAPLAVAKNSAAGTVLNDKLYVLGGRIDALQHKNLSSLEFYDAQQDKWHIMAPLPIPTAGFACAVLDNKIYAFGGEKYTYTNDGDGKVTMSTITYDDFWCYDPLKDSWQTAELKMTSTRHGLGAISLNNQIYLIGGAVKAGGTETTSLLEKLSYL